METWGKYEEAIKSLNQAIKTNPNNASAWHCKGDALEKLGSYVWARQSYDEAIRLESKEEPIVRYGWSESEKEQVRIRQDGKCTLCGKPPPRWEYYHRNGNRSDNSMSNCQGLCPNCHSQKSNEE